MSDSRFEELKNRLVAPGQPSFSCSEFHELYDYIQASQAEIASLINEIELCRNSFNINKINAVQNKLRQLSAEG